MKLTEKEYIGGKEPNPEVKEYIIENYGEDTYNRFVSSDRHSLQLITQEHLMTWGGLITQDVEPHYKLMFNKHDGY